MYNRKHKNYGNICVYTTKRLDQSRYEISCVTRSNSGESEGYFYSMNKLLSLLSWLHQWLNFWYLIQISKGTEIMKTKICSGYFFKRHHLYITNKSYKHGNAMQTSLLPKWCPTKTNILYFVFLISWLAPNGFFYLSTFLCPTEYR